MMSHVGLTRRNGDFAEFDGIEQMHTYCNSLGSTNRPRPSNCKWQQGTPAAEAVPKTRCGIFCSIGYNKMPSLGVSLDHPRAGVPAALLTVATALLLAFKTRELCSSFCRRRLRYRSRLLSGGAHAYPPFPTHPPTQTT